MAIVGQIANPVIVQSGDPLRDTSAAGLTDLARTTQNTNNTARITPTKQAGEIQQASREPRTTPPEVAAKTTTESNISRKTPEADKVTISNNARIARNPEPIPVGETTGNLNVGNNLNITA
jgi:hypothetical protein